LLHSHHVVAGARLHELDRQGAVFFEQGSGTVWVGDDGTSGLVCRDGVAASDDPFDGDLITNAAGVSKSDPRRKSVK